MTQKRKSVANLAAEAGIDADEALIRLWETGYDSIISAKEFVRQRELNRVRRILGIATKREFRQISYWRKLFKLFNHDFDNILTECGISLRPHQAVLDKKSISRLREYALKNGIDPILGCELEVKQVGPLKSTYFQLNKIGKTRDIKWLNAQQVKVLHYELVDDFKKSDDPVFPPGVRSNDLLESAVFRPQTSLDGTLKYPTVEMSAAALLHSIIQDHPFHNGNKRSALVAMLVFLDENCIYPEFDENELFKLVMQIAQHSLVKIRDGQLADREVAAISEWLLDRTRALDKTHKPIQFRKLKQILYHFGCSVEHKNSNTFCISREISIRPRWSFRKTETLRAHLHRRNDGAEISGNQVRRIREQLRLDDLHAGIDSHDFYKAISPGTRGFIDHYRKTLKRLAKL